MSQPETASHGEQTDAESSNRHLVTIKLNNRDVPVLGPRTTATEILAAGIKAGLPIQADFVLTYERGNGDEDVVGGADEVTVHPGSEFTAVAPDDNS